MFKPNYLIIILFFVFTLLFLTVNNISAKSGSTRCIEQKLSPVLETNGVSRVTFTIICKKRRPYYKLHYWYIGQQKYKAKSTQKPMPVPGYIENSCGNPCR